MKVGEMSLLKLVKVIVPMTYCNNSLRRHGYMLQIYTEDGEAIEDTVAMHDFSILMS
jgi:hypothetical protein